MLDAAPEFGEARLSGRPHPVDEMLVSHVHPLDVAPGQTLGQEALVDISELLRIPADVIISNINFLGSPVLKHLEESKCV